MRHQRQPDEEQARLLKDTTAEVVEVNPAHDEATPQQVRVAQLKKGESNGAQLLWRHRLEDMYEFGVKDATGLCQTHPGLPAETNTACKRAQGSMKSDSEQEIDRETGV